MEHWDELRYQVSVAKSDHDAILDRYNDQIAFVHDSCQDTGKTSTVSMTAERLRPCEGEQRSMLLDSSTGLLDSVHIERISLAVAAEHKLIAYWTQYDTTAE